MPRESARLIARLSKNVFIEEEGVKNLACEVIRDNSMICCFRIKPTNSTFQCIDQEIDNNIIINVEIHVEHDNRSRILIAFDHRFMPIFIHCHMYMCCKVVIIGEIYSLVSNQRISR